MRALFILFILSVSLNTYASEITKSSNKPVATQSFFDLVNNYDLNDNRDIRIQLQKRAGMYYLKSNHKDFKLLEEKIKNAATDKKKIKIIIEIPSMNILNIDD